MNHLHPHHQEEIDYQEGDHPDSAAYDRREAQMGADYNNNWQDEFILTSRDVWVTNPGYHGPASLTHPENDDGRDSYTKEQHAEYDAAYAAYWENEARWDSILQEAEEGEWV